MSGYSIVFLPYTEKAVLLIHEGDNEIGTDECLS